MVDWNDERDGQLREWRGAQYSYELISRRFTSLGHKVSKGSVIGRAFRLGLINRIKKKPRYQIDNHAKFKTIGSGSALFAKIKATRPAAAHLHRANSITNGDAAAGEFLGLDLLELDIDQCRYPQGDDPVLFCGQPQMEGSSYCPEHHRLCNVRTKALI